jgi:hypothetical protein
MMVNGSNPTSTGQGEDRLELRLIAAHDGRDVKDDIDGAKKQSAVHAHSQDGPRPTCAGAGQEGEEVGVGGGGVAAAANLASSSKTSALSFASGLFRCTSNENSKATCPRMSVAPITDAVGGCVMREVCAMSVGV